MVKLQTIVFACPCRNAVATCFTSFRLPWNLGLLLASGFREFQSGRWRPDPKPSAIQGELYVRHRTVAGILELPLPPPKAFAFVDFEAAFSIRGINSCGVRRNRRGAYWARTREPSERGEGSGARL
jgi:hypothetical protein